MTTFKKTFTFLKETRNLKIYMLFKRDKLFVYFKFVVLFAYEKWTI